MSHENIPLTRVNQWLSSWEGFNKKELGEAPAYFYIASMSLLKLRKLAGVYERTKQVRKIANKGVGYQRALNSTRTKIIGRYIEHGYPLSAEPKLDVSDNAALVHPGWLPTPILINVLGKDDERWKGNEKVSVAPDCLISIVESSGQEFMSIPERCFENVNEESLRPIEIIDGQHRVFAIDSINDFPDTYQVPIVVFFGLSQSWQAYLFWVINVEPKKINSSLAFDLYPELRANEWLEIASDHKIYRDHRSQELADILWKSKESPWADRIEIFGNRIPGHVSNAAFIRSLMSSFMKRATAQENSGGLFCSVKINGQSMVIPWKRSQQAAFLIFCWQELVKAAEKFKSNGYFKLLENEFDGLPEDKKRLINPHKLPAVIISGSSLLATDQGVQAIHYIYNVFCIKNNNNLDLKNWIIDSIGEEPDEINIYKALKSLSDQMKLAGFIKKLAEALILSFDWRTSSGPELSDLETRLKGAYRGSSGYVALKKDVLLNLSKCKDEIIEDIASAVLNEDQ
jgi:hypothetical protein